MAGESLCAESSLSRRDFVPKIRRILRLGNVRAFPAVNFIKLREYFMSLNDKAERKQRQKKENLIKLSLSKPAFTRTLSSLVHMTRGGTGKINSNAFGEVPSNDDDEFTFSGNFWEVEICYLVFAGGKHCFVGAACLPTRGSMLMLFSSLHKNSTTTNI